MSNRAVAEPNLTKLSDVGGINDRTGFELVLKRVKLLGLRHLPDVRYSVIGLKGLVNLVALIDEIQNKRVGFARRRAV